MYLRGMLLSCNDGGDIIALSDDGRGQLWSADAHVGGVFSNIVVLDNVPDGIMCVGRAEHRIACLDANGSTVWNTTASTGSAGDYVTVLSSARGGASLVSGALFALTN
jgi:hypothetical protein